MKTYELYFYRTKVLEPLKLKLTAELIEAEEADYTAWKAYEAMTDEEYYANAAVYDKQVDETSKRVQLLRMQVESVSKAVEAIMTLETEADYLEGIGLI